jgi:hypothetical protein
VGLELDVKKEEEGVFCEELEELLLSFPIPIPSEISRSNSSLWDETS